MQFQVPQFLDVEDKIFGPLTFKQAVYLFGGFGISYLFYRFIPWLTLAVIPMFASAAFGVALAYYRPNNKPFIHFVQASIEYFRNSRLYVWKRQSTQSETALTFSNYEPAKSASLPVSATPPSKLNDLTWSMDMSQKDIEVKKVHSESNII